MDSQAKALIVARAARQKHAEGVVVLDLRSLSSVTDFFVVCTAQSTRQIVATKDSIEETLQGHGCVVWHTEGQSALQAAAGGGSAPQWVLMDCGDVVVHIQDSRAREFYRLEHLWADAPRVPLDVPPASNQGSCTILGSKASPPSVDETAPSA